MQPAGVHGTMDGLPASRLPRLTGCRPSASLAGAMALTATLSSSPLGSGSWSRMPWTDGSALIFRIVSDSSAWEQPPGKRKSRPLDGKPPASVGIDPNHDTVEGNRALGGLEAVRHLREEALKRQVLVHADD